MAINVVSGGYWAAPRMRVMCAGREIPNLLSATVEQTSRYHAATFTAVFVLSVPGDDGDPAWWGNLGPSEATSGQTPPPQSSEVLFDFQIGLRPKGQPEGEVLGKWQSLLIARVDDFEIDLGDRTVHVTGRDLTARFIDAKTAQSYANQTASQIATMLAAGHGMQANVTATTTPVSRYYQAEHDKVTANQFHRTTTEWDLLTFLAQNEVDSYGHAFDVRVDGQTLYFGPGAAPDSKPWVARWEENASAAVSANLFDLKMHRNLTLAKDIEVKVISWHSQQGKQIVATSQKGAAGASKSGKSGDVQRYVIRRANLTLDQAQKLADATRHELSLHERVLELSAPGDLKLTPKVMMRLQGTNTSFDQTYYVDHVTREYTAEDGLKMHARCKNTSPVSEASATGNA